jgi:purine nucleoside phosphorylase
MGGNLFVLDLSGRKRARRDLMRPLTALAVTAEGEVAVGTADGGVLVCTEGPRFETPGAR